MKFNSLQFGKAMSAALFVLLLSMVGMKNAFAQNQVATLQHNDSIAGVFYGQNALVSAYNAAVAGDIITLSSGTFNGTDITKSISVRGAGCVFDTVTLVMPTIIPGGFYISTTNASFEGVSITGTGVVAQGGSHDVSFVKCHLNKIGYAYPNNKTSWSFVNCIIKDFDIYSSGQFRGMSIINSVVKFTHYYHTDNSNPTIIHNSIIKFDNGSHIKNIIAYNSIISTITDHTISNCSFFNCIGIETGETLLFEGQTTQNVMEVNNYEDVFETFDGTVTYDNIYQLKEEIATSFLGNDGSEVGIYGGMMPYNPRPSYMVMKRCNVAPRSTVDGKLSVDIEVFTGDE